MPSVGGGGGGGSWKVDFSTKSRFSRISFWVDWHRSQVDRRLPRGARAVLWPQVTFWRFRYIASHAWTIAPSAVFDGSIDAEIYFLSFGIGLGKIGFDLTEWEPKNRFTGTCMGMFFKIWPTFRSSSDLKCRNSDSTSPNWLSDIENEKSLLYGKNDFFWT